MKTCAKCKESLNTDQFGKNSRTKDGLLIYCKPCANARAAAYRLRNKHIRQQYLAKNEEKFREQRKADWAENRSSHLAKKYGITADQYDALIAAGCLICGHDDQLCIDHDHKCCPGSRSCGKCVRGALCRRCNVALGLFDEDIDRLMGAAQYLLQFENVLIQEKS